MFMSLLIPQDTAKHMHQEHLLGAKGDLMALVDGRRQAEDDDRTEVW